MKLDLTELYNDVNSNLSGNTNTKETTLGLIAAVMDMGLSFDVCDQCGAITDDRYICSNCGYDDSVIQDDRDEKFHDY